jgi:hypothetical protein
MNPAKERRRMPSRECYRLKSTLISGVLLSCAACGSGLDDAPRWERKADDSAGQIHGEADAGVVGCANEMTPPAVPAGLEVAGAALVASYRVEGTQTYSCASTVLDVGGLGPGSTSYAWVPALSRAALTSDCAASGSELGPTWSSSDGSSVVASPSASAPSPDAGAIAWTLSRAVSTSGHGVFEGVGAIQRLATHGGALPVEPCGPNNVHAERSVPFTATDFFYRAETGAP